MVALSPPHLMGPKQIIRQSPAPSLSPFMAALDLGELLLKESGGEGGGWVVITATPAGAV